jgi:hypothetical protein
VIPSSTVQHQHSIAHLPGSVSQRCTYGHVGEMQLEEYLAGASHTRARASRWDRIPVSRIKTTSPRRKGGATAKIFSSSSKVTMCGARTCRCLRKSTSTKGFREIRHLRSASRMMRLRTRRSWSMVAGSTPSANRASLNSSIRAPEISDNRARVNAAFNFPTEDPYRLRVFGCDTFARNASAHSAKGGGTDLGR